MCSQAHLGADPSSVDAARQFGALPAILEALRWTFSSTGKQPFLGVLTVNGKPVASLGEKALPPGRSLTYRGGDDAVICDQDWKEVGRVPVKRSEAVIRSGAVEVSFGCAEQKEAQLELELRTMGPGQQIGGR